MGILHRTMAVTILAALAATAASAVIVQPILVLSEDVPAGPDFDGASAAIPASRQGMVTLMKPLISHAAGAANDTGVTVPDFS